MAAAARTAPAVSVCIPAYRGAAHIGAAIESVLGQSLADLELLVIDDASPDATFEVASAYRDPRLRCLRNPHNLDAEGDWNRCLSEATGRYLKLLPQDDVLAPDCLRNEAEVLTADERCEIALVFCARTIIDGHGRPLLVRKAFGSSPRRVSGAEVFRRCLRRGTNVVGEPGGVLFRRDLARQVGAFDASLPYVVDLDYWLRLLAHGDAYSLPEPLVSFRVSAGAWSVAIGTAQSSQFRALATRVERDRRFGSAPLDLAVGRLLSVVNNALRLLLYRLLFARDRLRTR